GEDHALLASLGDDLRFVTITSAARLEKGEDGTEPVIEVSASACPKCERCWHYRDDVGSDPAHPTICARCTSNLFGAGETRRFACWPGRQPGAPPPPPRARPAAPSAAGCCSHWSSSAWTRRASGRSSGAS